MNWNYDFWKYFKVILKLILKYLWCCILPEGGKLQWIFIQIQNSIWAYSSHSLEKPTLDQPFSINKCIIFNNSYLHNCWSEYYQILYLSCIWDVHGAENVVLTCANFKSFSAIHIFVTINMFTGHLHSWCRTSWFLQAILRWVIF